MVEDAPEFARIGRLVLERAGLTVDVATSGERALEAASSCDYDLVILDVTLPGIDGFDVCRRLRAFTDTYILMVSGRDAEVDRVVGLRLGADDYITKPYSSAELEARISAVQRRPRRRPAVSTTRDLGGLQLDVDGREVRSGTTVLPLTRIEFDLLATLAASPGTVLSRAELLAAVWGHQQGDERIVDVHVGNLRRKLRCQLGHSRHVRTVRGVGYRLGGPQPADPATTDLASSSSTSAESPHPCQGPSTA